ncbi:hypothetical protein [Deinococcus hohokamensis]|uniref:Lipoprotein n=1 Tax=Deinococcus hohokamensis TaxID=309883 RepID=A0ABV9ICR7_9DEIO
MIKLLALFALLVGCARAECALRAQLTLPDYSALQDAAGSLDLAVSCDSPLEQTTLVLLAPGAQLSADHLLLTLPSLTPALYDPRLPRNDAVQVTLISAGPLLGGVRLSGSQTLRFVVKAARNQWVATGFYSLPLTFSLGQSLP